MVELLSNLSNYGLAVYKLRELTEANVVKYAEGPVDPPEPPAFRIHGLEARLGPGVVAKAVSRYEFGESATAIAKDLSVAPSALIRLLVSKQVVIRKHGRLTPEQDDLLAKEYDAGATMAELEAKHQLSHGVVSRALHRAGAVVRRPGEPNRHEQPAD